jgi:hypothetical protein
MLPAAIAGSSLLGAASARSAGAAQADAAGQATALQQRIYEEGLKRQQPFLDVGTNALNRLVALNEPGADVNAFLNRDPGYAFRVNEGLKALDRTAAARGGLLSGGTLKAAQRYGQDMASQEYTNAYNRIAGLANLGPSAAGVQNNLGTSYGTNASNLMTSGAAASAAGGMGAANAISGGVGQYLGYTSNNNLLNALRGNRGFAET